MRIKNMKWNATIVVTFFSIHTYWPKWFLKFYKILWSQIESFGTANWTKKVIYVFPRNIQYQERLKSPPFQIFWHCETFCSNFFPKWSLFQFFDALQQNGCWKFPKGLHFSFWCFATEWISKTAKVSPIRSNFLGFSGTVEEKTLTLWSP